MTVLRMCTLLIHLSSPHIRFCRFVLVYYLPEWTGRSWAAMQSPRGSASPRGALVIGWPWSKREQGGTRLTLDSPWILAAPMTGPDLERHRLP